MAKTSKINLIGQGCISSLIATRCGKEKLRYTQFARTPETLSVHHLTYGKLNLPTPKQLNHDIRLKDIVVLPLKAYVIPSVLQQLQTVIEPSCCIVLLHNGLGTIEIAKQLYPTHHIIAAITNTAAYRSHHTVIHTGHGNTFFGTVQRGNTSTETIKQHYATLERALYNAQMHEDIMPALWTKLAVNAVINPLTAIHDLQNGGLSAPSYKKLINQILNEILILAKAKDINIDHSTVLNTVNTVIYDTQDNYSSMQQDIEHGRRTEVDHISGYIVQEAESIGLQVPTNKRLWLDIHKLEGRW